MSGDIAKVGQKLGRSVFTKRAVALLLISSLVVTFLMVLFWFSHYPSQQDKELNVLLEMCSRAVENFRSDSI